MLIIHLKSREYETKSFTLSFKVEGAIMLREYVLGHFIRTQLQCDDFKAPLNIKEVFKVRMYVDRLIQMLIVLSVLFEWSNIRSDWNTGVSQLE